MRKIIVSRQAATVDFIRQQLPEFADAPVLASATPDDVRGAVVAGNLPLQLAALAAQVMAVEFTGPPPRGQEYGVAEMQQAGAKISCYVVQPVTPPQKEVRYNDGRKSRGYSDLLFVGKGDTVAQFAGRSIPGVVAIKSDHYEKNGKWSNTTYDLLLASGAWTLVSSNDWGTGERFHDAASMQDVIAVFRQAGCTAEESAIVNCLEKAIPNTVERIRRKEEELNSIR